jgi:hypothetical protein
MPHILGDAIEALEAKMSNPPTTAQSNLHTALTDADNWAHEHPTQTEVIAQIQDAAGRMTDYVNISNPPSDIRLQGYADELNGLI